MAAFRRQFPGIIGASLFWALIFAAYLLFGKRQPAAQPIEIAPPPVLAVTPVVVETPAPLRIYVSGAVLAPGIYRLPPDSLAADAIALAGGGAPEADLTAINLAHVLVDGEQVHVPVQGEAARAPQLSLPMSGNGVSAGAVLPSTLIDLNTATALELEALPGVGPKMAEAILAGRPYGAVEDLLRVKGVGDVTLEKLRPYVKVE